MNFLETVEYCMGVPEFVENFNRLSGHTLGESIKLSPIERMVDDASGFNPEAENIKAFMDFVHEFVWIRVTHDQHS